jgi:DNA-binding response OmpR family regulator
VPALLLAGEEHLPTLDQPPVADDFLLAPFRPVEFLARVRLLLWRMHRTNPSHLIIIGDLAIDQSTYQVRVGGERAELTYKEYALLRFLASHRGKVFTREALLSHVWGYDYYGGVRTVDVHVRRIRAKLGEPSGSYLETVRNVGYRFADACDAGEA